MIHFPKAFLFFLLSTACFCSCKKQDELSAKSVIQSDKAEETYLDKWLDSTFSAPYNIAVLYRWESSSFDTRNGLVPATPEKIRPALEAIAHIWGGTFMHEQTGGKDFIKKYAPRQLYIYGNGNPFLAQTASGNSIRSAAIYNVDSFTEKDEKATRRLLWSFYNQYIKSLMQTVPFDRDAFAKCNIHKPYGTNVLRDLSSDDVSYELLDIPLNIGFFGGQGFLSIEEDFAETITAMLLHSRGEVENVIKKAGRIFPFSGEVQRELEKIRAEQSQRSLQEKKDFVIKYFKEKLNMDLYRLQYIGNRRLQAYLNQAGKEEKPQ